MHFAAWLAVGESVQKPLDVLPEQRHRHARACSTAMRDAGVKRFIFSSTCAVYGEPASVPIVETLPNAARSTPTAKPSWPSSARCRTSNARYGIRWIALRYFNAAGAHPDGTIGEDHAHEIHLIPRAIDAATGGAPLQVFGEDYPTPDGTCLRDYIHVCDLADAHVRALRRARARGAVRRVQCRHRHARIRCAR